MLWPAFPLRYGVAAMRSFVAALPLFFIVLSACGSDDAGSPPSSSGGDAAASCAPREAPQKPAAACDVTIENVPIAGFKHVPQGTPLTFCTNPPTSGDHYPIWAAYREYDKPLEWGNLVHSMEHGAILLLYKCDDGRPCPEVLDAFRQVLANTAEDPLCDPGTKRIIIAPAPTLDTKVAAAAWDAIYTAPCADVPTLDAFVRDHYAKTHENLCIPGQVF